MSGGSWDYVYGTFANVAARLKKEGCPRRRALGRLVEKVATALYEIEWVDSNDKSHPAELPAIAAALGKDGPALVLAEAVRDAEECLARLAEALREAKGGG